MIVFRFVIADEVIIEFLFCPLGGGIRKIILIEDGQIRLCWLRCFEITNGQGVEMNVCAGAIYGLNKKSHFSGLVIGVIEFTNQPVIDMQEEIRTLRIYAQNIFSIKIMNTLFDAFL